MKPTPQPQPAVDELVDEMLGRGDPNLPEAPVLLGEYSAEEAEACGAFHDPALRRAAEIHGLGPPYRPRDRRSRGLPSRRTASEPQTRP